MQPDFHQFFQTYAAAYNRSLGEAVDVPAIRHHFAESFIGAGPQGVMASDNNEAFGDVLEKGYAFYKAIGTQHMALDGLEVNEIEPHHFVVKVRYRASYEKKGKTAVIPFTVTYLLQHRDQQLKIFAFMAGDEMALYRQHGLIDAQGNPTE